MCLLLDIHSFVLDRCSVSRFEFYILWSYLVFLLLFLFVVYSISFHFFFQLLFSSPSSTLRFCVELHINSSWLLAFTLSVFNNFLFGLWVDGVRKEKEKLTAAGRSLLAVNIYFGFYVEISLFHYISDACFFVL